MKLDWEITGEAKGVNSNNVFRKNKRCLAQS